MTSITHNLIPNKNCSRFVACMCLVLQSKETKVMSLQLPEAIRDGLITAATALVQPTWQWLVKVLDVAQGQLEQGQAFDTTVSIIQY